MCAGGWLEVEGPVADWAQLRVRYPRQRSVYKTEEMSWIGGLGGYIYVEGMRVYGITGGPSMSVVRDCSKCTNWANRVVDLMGMFSRCFGTHLLPIIEQTHKQWLRCAWRKPSDALRAACPEAPARYLRRNWLVVSAAGHFRCRVVWDIIFGSHGHNTHDLCDRSASLGAAYRLELY